MARPAGWRMAGALAAGLLWAAPLQAADALPTDPVRREVARHVPAPWRLEDLTVESGPSGESPPSVRVAARVRLAEPTFTLEGRDGPYSFVRPVAEEGMQKTLVGVATGTRTKGVWAIKLDLRNPEVLDGIGQPMSALPGQPVLVGSDEAKAVQARLAAEAKQRLVDEQARRAREEEILAKQKEAARVETERTELERSLVEMRAAEIAGLRAKLLGAERPARVAAYEAALGGNDAALRQFAIEAALQSRDPVLANLALKDWLARKRSIPIQVYATKEDPHSDTVLRNMGPLTLDVESFNRVNGNVGGRMGAPGYSIMLPSSASGVLAQTELNVNSYGCTLTLRLTEHQTLDGLFRCQTLPTLVARITLD